MIQMLKNVSLAKYSTMRLGGNAQALVEVHDKNELLEALDWANSKNLPILVLGGGSNVIFKNGFDGLVIVNRISGFEVLEDTEDGAAIRLGAGEEWDGAVEHIVKMELSGVELLSFIPGTCGAMPVQNVGAYGAEIADVFVELEAYDIESKSFVVLDKAACEFSYRDSIFKSPEDRRYIITSVTIELTRTLPSPPFYKSLQKYLDENNISEYTVQNIRDAVIEIRKVKLPDPEEIANTGSFFKNPIISWSKFEKIQKEYPDIPNWEVGDKIKIPAGWMIDKADLKGYKSNGMKIYEKNALVFVNESAKSYSDLNSFKQEIIKKIEDKFGVTLEQEPELI